MIVLIIVVLGLAAPPHGPSRDGGRMPASVEAALRKALAGQARSGTAVARLEPGPLGTQVATLDIPKAYPGTGVARAVVFGGISYGKHGERTLADLARNSGWHRSVPNAEDLARVVNASEFEGLLALDGAGKTLNSDSTGLTLRFVRVAPFNPRDRAVVTAVIPVEGQATITVVREAPAAP